MPSPFEFPDLQPAAALRPAVPLDHRSNRVMWINHDRVFYAGLLGAVTVRTMGGWHVYVSLGSPIHIAVADGPWQTTDLAVVPPYLPHRLKCDERLIGDLVIEPETVDQARLPDFIRGRCGAVDDAPQLVRRLRLAHAWLRERGREIDLRTTDFDECFLGERLAPRTLDVRIAGVIDSIRRDPSQPTTAQDCAAAVGLSFSRFLHLFKEEVGAPFRSVRTWKRARSLLHYVTRDANLAHVALDAGYPDSTHFSHSIRQVYGLKPRDLFAGSRKLVVLGDSPDAQRALQ